MNWINRNIAWLLVVYGVATCSMLVCALAPHFAADFIFGVDDHGVMMDVVFRSWGVVIFASGAAMVYAASHQSWRAPVMTLAILGKSSFVIPVLLLARQLSGQRAIPMAVADIVMIATFGWYLTAS